MFKLDISYGIHLMILNNGTKNKKIKTTNILEIRLDNSIIKLKCLLCRILGEVTLSP